ncbi:hypothetical protein MPH_00793 [Macrophomina phaseolina MS6]|uniref:Uncharacterized protein n=1 Tax=Macrophomina phaseolina (strain MS6) TaxID=1126212 RepID=K2S4I8_MACPH|nr:hypothetical protein MPH_00793 [Macrophomina phaseolina MS6]
MLISETGSGDNSRGKRAYRRNSLPKRTGKIRWLTMKPRSMPIRRVYLQHSTGLPLRSTRTKPFQDKLERLERATSILDEVSEAELKKKKKGIEGKQELSKTDIRASLRLNRYYYELEAFVEEDEEARKAWEKPCQWAHSLRMPDRKGDVEDWDSLGVLDVDFSLRMIYPTGSPACKKLTAEHNRAISKDTADLLRERLERWVQSESGTNEAKSNGHCLSRKRRSIPFQSIFEKGSLQDQRAYIASRKNILAWPYGNHHELQRSR